MFDALNHCATATRNRGFQIADESNRQSLCVTCDPAIARMTLKIQKEESPNFDRLFIDFGSFHIEMAFFHSIGSNIVLSGGPSILSQAGIIASNPLRGFISGTHFNRCKRIHKIFAAAMEICQFNAFLSLTNTDAVLLNFDLKQAFKMINEGGTQLTMDSLPPEILDLCSRYVEFTEEMKRGEHGKTAKYWTQYIEMVHLYHGFSRSVRESDLDLFIHTIPKISCFFLRL